MRSARIACFLLGVPLMCAAGCSFFSGDPKKSPPPIEFSITSPYSSVKTFAIAPAINLSPNHEFDALAVSDTLYEEMQQVPGLHVVPVNKTIIAMQHLGMHNIDDVHAAQRLAEALGADGLIIPAITAYDPYNPPVVGMILQMYTPENAAAANALPPPQAPMVQSNPGAPVVVAADVTTAMDANHQPVAQVSAVFNATNQTVLKELALFARGRTQYDSALMDQKFLADADSYMRFVCHAMVRRLLDVERDRSSDR